MEPVVIGNTEKAGKFQRRRTVITTGESYPASKLLNMFLNFSDASPPQGNLEIRSLRRYVLGYPLPSEK